MSRAALVRLLVAQTVLLVVVAWAGIWFARDEYRRATAPLDDDEGLARAAAAVEEDGVPTVRLSVAAQRNVGIEVAMPEPASHGAEAQVAVVVQDAQPLIELQGRLRAARHQLEAARSQSAASGAEARRVQALYDDDRNASLKALESARAQAAADAAREREALAALRALREGARLPWGAALARELEDDAAGGRVARIASGRELLLRALLRGDAAAPERAQLAVTLPGRDAPLLARPLGGVGTSAAGGEAAGARSLLFQAAWPANAGRAPAAGQRYTGQLRDADRAANAGVLVPASAIVWHAGQPWIYIRESNEPQPVYAPLHGEPLPGMAASAAAPKPAPEKPAKRDDDDDDKPRPGSASAASAPAAKAAAAAEPPPAATHAFQRRAVPQARRVGDHWFLDGYAEDDPVVVRGAQVLLSEELKYQIRNENDD
ncbi:MAG TPA: hypothetical protein VFR90_17470 [Methylibium sp.]|uniref:hypothetical protein n=1 Tax=Methylibium sp. TaxID=2067992 RepID=UPI002DB8DFED|nr:hypothetical protein [Methylibium sp.]HEU4460914.1 hypothetical protein [Methylibium sp.]